MIIPLSKQDVPVVRNNATVVNKTAYYGNISAGSPAKQFSVVFDTGSGHIILPSRHCETLACMQRMQFDVEISQGSKKTYRDPKVAVVFGTGQVDGRLSEQTLCISDGGLQDDSVMSGGKRIAQNPIARDVCFDGTILLAMNMSDKPFSDFVFDGVLGLGLPGLAVEPEYSIWSMWNVEVLGLFISHTEGVPSELALGGHDESRLAGEVLWAPVHQPELGYWQIKLEGLTLGGEEFEGCSDGGCTAIVDSGSSAMGIPRSLGQGIFSKLSWKVDDPLTDCREGVGPDMAFRFRGLEGNFDLSLSRREYARASPIKGKVCSAAFLPMPHMGSPMSDRVFILGEPMLRKYYTAYAAARRQVGFAPTSLTV